jgi:tetraacyldisaccharide 4'-kinase
VGDSTHSQTPLSQQAWLDAWYGARRWTLWLLPFMWVFIALSNLRRWWICRFSQTQLATPVIVVGNISVGGTGKTPLLITLVKYLQQQGFTPGVISRGYGGKAESYPYLLDKNSTVIFTGDEPLSIYQRTGCAVCVGPNRVAAARLLEDQGCDIVLSDDGLQHYRLGRDIEIAVVDGQRALGNGFRLPVGPLREAAARLKIVDWVVVNTPRDNFLLEQIPELFYTPMTINSQSLVNVLSGDLLPANYFSGQQVHAVAGIGNPGRFYSSLQKLGVAPVEHSFPDHHAYVASDLDFAGDMPLLMTEKDAVKCRSFARENWFYLAIDAQLPDIFWSAFLAKIHKVIEQKKSAF